jgi:glycine/D-amino acid oxidase-like deaminating enzyme
MKHNLISIGGPDTALDEMAPYSHKDGYPEDMSEKIDRFVRQTYGVAPHTKIDYAFTWHGLMGYTRHGVRLVGPEPQNPVLLYNLGCNGVGILPSIYGGQKIARHLVGERVPASIFDVPPSLHLRRA